MTKEKKDALWVLVGIVTMAALFMLIGFMAGKAVYSTNDSVKVERDTILVHDTIPDYQPTPKDSARIKWITRWLPSKNDTIINTETIALHDSVLVEVPITSKHYSSPQYDAYVSGYEPSLDSIFVYQEKEIITEKITITKTKRKPCGIGFSVGYGYDFHTKTASPYVGVGISYDILSF